MRSIPSLSREEAFLLNPPFVSLLLRSTALGYREQTGSGISYTLAFMSAPLALHKQTRTSLPRSTRTSMAAWLQQNTHLRVGFAERAKSLSPFLRKAVLFGAAHGMLAIESGRIVPVSSGVRLRNYIADATEDVRECINRAEFVGRWFGSSGTTATIMSLWGVAP